MTQMGYAVCIHQRVCLAGVRSIDYYKNWGIHVECYESISPSPPRNDALSVFLLGGIMWVCASTVLPVWVFFAVLAPKYHESSKIRQSVLRIGAATCDRLRRHLPYWSNDSEGRPESGGSLKSVSLKSGSSLGGNCRLRPERGPETMSVALVLPTQ